MKNKNLKVIVLNTQSCYLYNFDIMQNLTDPSEQVFLKNYSIKILTNFFFFFSKLHWLRQELYVAEKNKEDVIITGHM